MQPPADRRVAAFVPRRCLDIFTTVFFDSKKVHELIDLDSNDTPPLNSPWDSVQMAVQDWVRNACKAKIEVCNPLADHERENAVRIP